MTDFFSSIAEDVVRGVLTELADQQDVLRLVQIQKNWDFFRGDQIQYLLQEDEDFFRRRPETTKDERDAVKSKIRTHLNYTRLIVHRFLNGCYGLEVKRKAEDDANQRVLEDIWESNKMQAFMFRAQRVTELEGLCAVIPRWKESERRIVYEKYGAQHLIPIPCPDDPTNLHALILSWTADNKWGLVPDIVEGALPGVRTRWRYNWSSNRNGDAGRRHGPQKYAEIWTAERIQAYLGKEMLVDTENPYRQLPFAFFRAEEDDASFWGQTVINDVVAINHVINRLLSDLIEIIRVHGFSLLFVSGELVDELVLKPTSFLRVTQTLAEGSSTRPDAKYLTPNSPIREIQEFIDWFVNRLADTSQVPSATITGGDQSESGFALTIRWLPYTQMLGQKRNGFKASEQDLASKTLLVSQTHLGKGDPGKAKISIEFVDDTFFPSKEDEQRARDAFLLANDVITPLDLLRKQQPDLTEEQLLERFTSNVRFNRQIRAMAEQAGTDMNAFTSALQSEALRARVREKTAQALLDEEMEMQGRELGGQSIGDNLETLGIET